MIWPAERSADSPVEAAQDDPLDTDDEETKKHEAHRPGASQSGVTNGD